MYCPNCATEMVGEKRKLGRGNQKWSVCPKCGVREEEDSPETLIEKSVNGMFKRDRKGLDDE